MTFDEAKNVSMMCNSYERMYTLLHDLIHEVEYPDWLKLLGEEWSCCDNISLYKSTLAGFLKKPTPEMMDEEEQRAFDQLPEVFTIYRGCYSKNKHGLSWTLSKEVAEKFPLYIRYRGRGIPLLVTAQVKKANVIALKLDREEQEIITWQPKIISIDELAYLVTQKQASPFDGDVIERA